MSQLEKGYEVIRVTDLIKLERKGDASLLFQDENTHATIYELKDGRFTLSPAAGPLGLLIKDRQALDEILRTKIPIEQEHISPFEKYFSDTSTFDSRLIIKKLFSILKLPEKQTFNSKAELALIEEAIKKFPISRRYDEILVPLGVFIGSEILKKNKGNWVWVKQYKINPYYILCIKTNDGDKIDPYYKLADKLLVNKGKKLDIWECIQRPFIIEKFYKKHQDIE